jgi:ABC-type uncharacterized transport system involved in gliding motility auxiliary subunit
MPVFAASPASSVRTLPSAEVEVLPKLPSTDCEMPLMVRR